MTTTVPDWAADAARLPYPTVFVTVSGAHLYGFASVDSDLDLRASHLLPATEVLGLHTRDTSALPGHADSAAVAALHDLVVRAPRLTTCP